LARRLDGEPLPWLTGTTTFLGAPVRVDRGVYVPRFETELVARRAIQRLPAEGVAVDLATGSGAVAVALRRAWPSARVVASDIDVAACRCAAANGVEVYRGDLGAPLPTELHGRVDLVVAVLPYVPSAELEFLPRDVRRHEPRRAHDGGPGGVELLRRAIGWAAVLSRPGAALVLEVGGDQDRALEPDLHAAGFAVVGRIVDDDGDLRGIEAALN